MDKHKGERVQIQLQSLLKHEIRKSSAHVKRVLVWCYDPRFSNILEIYVHEKLKLSPREYTRIEIPGGALSFAQNNQSALEFLAITVEKHGPRIVDIMMHNDCAACGNESDPEYYYKQLIVARGNVLSYFKNSHRVQVNSLYADFNGISIVDPMSLVKADDIFESAARS